MAKLAQMFGFWFHHGGHATFVIDSRQLASVNIPYRDRVLSTDELKGMMLIAATKYDAVYFSDVDTTVEPAVLARSAPRFVILETISDKHRLARMYDPATGYGICKDQSGNVVYEIIGFADGALDLNRVLYADEHHGFPQSTLRKALKH